MCPGKESEKVLRNRSFDRLAAKEGKHEYPPLLQHASYHEENPNLSNAFQGYYSMAISAVCQAGMAFFAHLAETSYGFPSNSALIARAVVSSIMSLVYLYINNLFYIFCAPAAQLFGLGIVGLLSSITIYCTLLALERLPVGTVVTVVYSSPAITSVLSAIFLKDAFTISHALILATNFLGIALVSQPSTVDSATPGTFLVGIAFSLAAALSVSVVYTVLRALGHSTHFVSGSVALSVGLVVFSFIFGNREALDAFRTNTHGAFFVTISGMCGFGSQVMLGRGLQNAPAGPAAVVRSLNVPISFILGLVFLHEVTNSMGLLGIMLVLSSIGAIGWRQWCLDSCRQDYIPVSHQRDSYETNGRLDP